MVHLHSPLLPRPPAPPPVPGESPLGKSKLDMSPLEPLRVPPHVSSAVSHPREKPGGEGEGEGEGRADTQFLDYFKAITQSSHWVEKANSGIKHLYLSLHMNSNLKKTNLEASTRAARFLLVFNLKILFVFHKLQVIKSGIM